MAKGFTLLELMVVLAILGMTAAIATPALSRLVSSLEAENQRKSIETFVRSLPVQVMERGSSLTLDETATYEPLTATIDSSISSSMFTQDLNGSKIMIPSAIDYRTNGTCTGGEMHWLLPEGDKLVLTITPPYCVPRTVIVKSSPHTGFALLEALVAIVIVASVGTALFALVNTGLTNLARAEAHVTTTTLQPRVLAWLRTLSLDELPEAEHATLEIQGQDAIYVAEAELSRIHGPVPARTAGGAEGIHLLALYDVQVTIFDNERKLDSLFTRRVASRQIAEPPGQ